MVKFFSLFIARRYIGQQQLKGFTSFISASSTIGIAIGVMVLIIVLSAMNGFERALSQHLLSVVPHSELIGVNNPVNNWPNELKQVQNHPGVKAAAPLIKMQGMLQHKEKLKGVEVRGVDLALERQVSAIPDYLIEGDWSSLAQENSIIIGHSIAKKIGVSIGDKVQLLLPPMQADNQVNNRFNAMKKRNFVVSGIYRFGGEIDAAQTFISLQNAQSIMGYQPDEVQGLRVSVNHVFDASRTSLEAAYKLNTIVYIYDWTITQGHLYKDIQLVRLVMFIVLVMVIGVASFNIVSTLIMSVNEKRGDIAILKTMGARHRTIMTVFVLQGLRNGVIGTIIGVVLGILISLNLTEMFAFVESLMSKKFLSGDIYFIDYLPTYVQTTDIIFTTIIALFLTIVATLYPAWQATKIEPAKVLGQL